MPDGIYETWQMTRRNKFQWNLNENMIIDIQENVVCKMATILFGCHCVNSCMWSDVAGGSNKRDCELTWFFHDKVEHLLTKSALKTALRHWGRVTHICVIKLTVID